MERSGREPAAEEQYFAALEALRESKRLLAGSSNASSIGFDHPRCPPACDRPVQLLSYCEGAGRFCS